MVDDEQEEVYVSLTSLCFCLHSACFLTGYRSIQRDNPQIVCSAFLCASPTHRNVWSQLLIVFDIYESFPDFLVVWGVLRVILPSPICSDKTIFRTISESGLCWLCTLLKTHKPQTVSQLQVFTRKHAACRTSAPFLASKCLQSGAKFKMIQLNLLLKIL